jgi:hypothetical protein
MQTIIDDITKYCAVNILREKWLIAPNLRIGNQWSDWVAKKQPILNLRIYTLPTLAMEIASTTLRTRNQRLLSSDEASLLMLEAFSKLKQESKLKYLGHVKPSLELGALLSSDWDRLSLAGKSFADGQSKSFSNPDKLADLQVIEQEFERLLQERRTLPMATIFQEAAKLVASHASAIPADVAILLPDGLAHSPAEIQFIQAMQARVHAIGGSQQADHIQSKWESRTDLEFFAALGEVNEVRQVLRVCAQQGWSLDQVEVVCSDPDTYTPLFYEEISARAGEYQGLGDRLPVTFSRGVPTRYSRPGRALGAFVGWIEAGFPQATLVRMLQEGLLELPASANERQISSSRLGRNLRSLAIGSGLEKYEQAVDAELAVQDEKASLPTNEDDDAVDDPEESKPRVEAAKQTKQVLQTLKELIADLRQICDGRNLQDPQDILATASEFLKKRARSVNQIDRFAKQSLLEQIESMRSWLAASASKLHLNILDWLTDLAQTCRVLGSSPLPGCLHVAGIQDGGASGRPFLFILGMDDQRFPPSGSQSPLLLDDEALELSPELKTGEKSREEAVQRLKSLVAESNAHVHCSYTALSIESGRTRFPCYPLLDLFRAATKNLEASQEDFIRHVAPRTSFAPQHQEQSLNVSDWLLWRLTTTAKLSDPRDLTYLLYPNIRSGDLAVANRKSTNLTEHDGLVPKAGDSLSPYNREVINSPSRLEAAGTCPRRFFFRYGLKLKPLDKPEPQDVWLNALEVGIFLHTVLEKFGNELIATKSTFQESNAKRFMEIFHQQLKEERQLHPPPSERAFEMQASELETTLRDFHRREVESCKILQCAPVQVEAQFGFITQPSTDGPFQSKSPVEINIGDAKILMRGKIDRIDAVKSNSQSTISIWDYKSGSAYKFNLEKPINGGRNLQPFIYSQMLVPFLGKGQTIQEVGYVFTRNLDLPKSRVAWKPQEFDQGRDAIELISNIIQQGYFHPTENESDCKYCDFKTICGNPKLLTIGLKKKQENVNESAVFASFKSLRDIP